MEVAAYRRDALRVQGGRTLPFADASSAGTPIGAPAHIAPLLVPPTGAVRGFRLVAGSRASGSDSSSGKGSRSGSGGVVLGLTGGVPCAALLHQLPGGLTAIAQEQEHRGIQRLDTGALETGGLDTRALATGLLDTRASETGDLDTEALGARDLGGGEGMSGDVGAEDSGTGDSSTGHEDAGHLNAGDLNTGDLNAGNLSTGDLRTGDLNAGGLSTGQLSTRNEGTRDAGTGAEKGAILVAVPLAGNSGALAATSEGDRNTTPDSGQQQGPSPFDALEDALLQKIILEAAPRAPYTPFHCQAVCRRWRRALGAPEALFWEQCFRATYRSSPPLTVHGHRDLTLLPTDQYCSNWYTAGYTRAERICARIRAGVSLHGGSSRIVRDCSDAPWKVKYQNHLLVCLAMGL